MSALKLVLWGFLAVLGSVALAFVVGFVNPQERVNGLWLVVAAACIYVLAFRFYGRWISRRVVEQNDQRVIRRCGCETSSSIAGRGGLGLRGTV
jgi:carbon starvation protein